LRGSHRPLLDLARVHPGAVQIGSDQPDDTGISDPFLKTVDQDIVRDSVERRHDRLPITKTFRFRLSSPANGIRLKDAGFLSSEA
jgi:hypothetical protein